MPQKRDLTFALHASLESLLLLDPHNVVGVSLECLATEQQQMMLVLLFLHAVKKHVCNVHVDFLVTEKDYSNVGAALEVDTETRSPQYLQQIVHNVNKEEVHWKPVLT